MIALVAAYHFVGGAVAGALPATKTPSTVTLHSATASLPATKTPSTVTLHSATTCLGVNVSPPENLQTMFAAHPAGTTFCFAPGTYVLTRHVRPKSYDRLISVTPRAAVLTGLNVYDGGIVGSGGPYGQHDVLVQGFVFHDFVNAWPIFPRSALQAGDNWIMRDNEISHNSQAGVTVNNGSQLVGNWIHHNGRYGFAGGPLTNLLVADNDVSFNNTGHYDPNNDAGGSKIIKSSKVVFRGNRVHDNYGNGLWCDWENISITYEGNTLERNRLAGIFHEASADAVIRNNTFRGNGIYALGHSLWWSADLFLNDSKNTQIYGNTILAGVNGIGLIDIDRGSNKYGLLEIRNVSVHDNAITLPAGGVSGMVFSRTTRYTPGNNHFIHNAYKVSNTLARFWTWPRYGIASWAEWHNAGNDRTGRLAR